MALKPETSAHLARAARNREVARTLSDPQQVPSLHPPPLERAAVAAFYAAVHYVNAFLWERLGQDPRDHTLRRRYVARTTQLHRALSAYDLLADLSWHARYTATFQPRPAVLQNAVHEQLEQVREVVYRALGEPLP